MYLSVSICMTSGLDMDGALIRQVHKAVIAAGKTRSGCTVHQVTEEVDSGPIVVQEEVEVTPEETPETLKAKVNYEMCRPHSPSAHVDLNQRMSEPEKNQYPYLGETGGGALGIGYPDIM